MHRRAVCALVSAAVLATLAACGGGDGDADGDGGNGAGEGVSVNDPSGRAACERFRAVAADAQAETATRRQIVSRLQRVGDLAADSTDKVIRQFGARVAEEANARALISGAPNTAQDKFANACNERFPLEE